MHSARGKHASGFLHANSARGSDSDGRPANFAHPARNVAVLGVQPGMTVADFGSGSGAYVLAIAEALQGRGHVYAIDIQKDLLRRTKNEAAKVGYTNIEVLWGDLEVPGGSKIADGIVDLVLISNLLFQIDDKRAVLAEAKRVTRSNGRIAVIDWSGSPRAAENGGSRVSPHKNDIVTKEQVLTLARSNELTFVNEFFAGTHHYGLLFRKSKP